MSDDKDKRIAELEHVRWQQANRIAELEATCRGLVCERYDAEASAARERERIAELEAEVERLEAEVDRAHEQQDSWRRVAEKTESENLGLRAALAELEEKR